MKYLKSEKGAVETVEILVYLPLILYMIVYLIMGGLFLIEKNELSTVVNKKLDRAIIEGQFTDVLKEELINELDLKGFKKAVLSNKSENFSKDIIENLGLKEYFDEIYGGDSFDEKKPSPKPIREIMNFLSVKKENTVMVGDGVNDVLAGKTAGVRTIAVLYGYSSKEKIENLQPDFIAAAPQDVVNILNGVK